MKPPSPTLFSKNYGDVTIYLNDRRNWDYSQKLLSLGEDDDLLFQEYQYIIEHKILAHKIQYATCKLVNMNEKLMQVFLVRKLLTFSFHHTHTISLLVISMKSTEIRIYLI